MSLIDENMAEQAAIGWFEELGYQRVFGPDIAPQGPQQERENYKVVVLADRLLTAMARINPHIPAAVLEDAARQVIHGNAAGLMQAIRYRNRAIETAQVIEELIEMAKSFNEAARRGDELGLSADELAFYDALETNQSSVRELGDSVLKEIARQITNFLRKNLSVDWSVRETVRAKMRAQIKLILKRHKYPPDMEARAVELVLKQAEALSDAWMAD